jgi:phosphate butyryltransferase
MNPSPSSPKAADVVGFRKSRHRPAFILPANLSRAIVSSMKNFSEILEAARLKGACRPVVAQAADESILKAMEEARIKGIANPVLVGSRPEIEAAAAGLGIQLSSYRIVEPPSKGEAAAEAVRLIARGEGDVLVKGMLQTAELLHAALDKNAGIGCGRTLSHVGVFLVPVSRRFAERFLMITDAALVIAPTLQQKAEIAQNAIDLAHRLGIASPVVAVLCALETVNPSMPATLDAACLSKMAERGQITGGRVEGPLALDNAVSEEAARRKGISSELAGRADILLAPDIEAANILYKSLVFFADAVEAGLVVGARVPIVVTSRADSAENKLYSIALGSLAR